MKKKYSSKTSVALLLFVFLVFFAPLIPSLTTGGFNAKILLVIGVLLVVFGLILHMFLKTEYIIDGKELKIRSGIFSYKPIKIEEIKDVANTSSKMASPAPSFDRIEVKHGKFDSVIISPRDKSNFVRDLKKVNPDIKEKVTEN